MTLSSVGILSLQRAASRKRAENELRSLAGVIGGELAGARGPGEALMPLVLAHVTLAPGAYVVVARDAAAMQAAHPGVTVLGSYSGRLAKKTGKRL